MGAGTAVIKLMLELWQRGHFKGKGSVIDMGSQYLTISIDDFEDLITRSGISGYKRETFLALKNPPCSTKPFYELLGLSEYASADMNPEFPWVKCIDLNKELEDKSLWGKYDLVTDFGTAEHCFNIAEVYRTIHRLCRKHGLIVVGQMVFNTNGYYTFDRSFFAGLAAANNYRVLFSSFVINVLRGDKFDQWHIPCSRELLATIDWAKTTSEIAICVVLQKVTDEDFKMPYQFDMLSKALGNDGYQLQFLPEPPSYTFLPMFQQSNLWIGQMDVEVRAARLNEAVSFFESNRIVLGDAITNQVLEILRGQQRSLQGSSKRSIVVCTLPIEVG
jgi:hypothetical protein